MNSIIFIVWTLLSSFFSLKSNKNNSILILVSVVVYCYLIATRDIFSVPDTIVYYDDFYQNQYSFDSFKSSPFEIGFQLLAKISYVVFFGDIRWFFGFVTLLNVIIILRSMKNFSGISNINFVIALNFYFAFFGLFYNAIVIRQGLAISIVIFIISVLYKKDLKLNFFEKIKILLLVVIAFFIHSSTFFGILVVLCFRYSKVKSFNFYVWLLIFSVIVYFTKFGLLIFNYLLLFVSYLQSYFSFLGLEKYLYYSDVLNEIELNVSFKILFFYLVALLVLLKNFKEFSGLDKRIYFCFMLGVFFISLFGFFSQISRILDYFLVFSFVLLSKSYVSLVKFDDRILFILIVLVVQEFFVFRIINGV